MFDLPLPKSWHFFEGDDATQCYYVQPASGSVAWAMPEGCVPCENHSQRFAAYYCQDCGIMLCDECNNGNISMKTLHRNLKLSDNFPAKKESCNLQATQFWQRGSIGMCIGMCTGTNLVWLLILYNHGILYTGWYCILIDIVYLLILYK